MAQRIKALPFHEPTTDTILIQAAFLLLLNIINSVLDHWIHCGLVGQIFLGTVWGEPLANWLSEAAQETVVQLGYLGLILMVYEGGLSTDLGLLRRNLGISLGVAVTGIGLPIGLSFLLIPLLGASPVQAFAAGASLCSTSLGTTFTIFASNGLSKSRDGVITIGAAMIDDVVGLIMVQIIQNLGGDGELSAIVILRPIIASVAAVFFLLLVAFGLRYLVPSGVRLPDSSSSIRVVLHMLLLYGFVAGMSYAGASSLLAAYLAGVTVNWWHIREQNGQAGVEVWEMYLQGPVVRLLKPLFFASIGFAIPIRQMFSAKAVWCGITYAILMAFAKFCCGLWMLPFKFRKTPLEVGTPNDTALHSVSTDNEHEEPARSTMRTRLNMILPQIFSPLLVGSAMIARGEIGFLIASIAQSNGIFSGTDGSPLLFLVVIWAVVLCTITGPVLVGIITKHKDLHF